MSRHALLFPIFILLCQVLPVLADSGTVHVTGNVLSPSCSITDGQDMTITLDDVHPRDLPSVGSTWGQSDTNNITLSCVLGSKVSITFAGTTISGSSTVLQNGGSAEGVGVQLVDRRSDSNHAIDMGYVEHFTASDSTTVAIPIAARYYRTGDLSSGTVDVTATYTLNYD